ncbi:S9 family peptidase [Sandarakinorhabdus sp.]|uniref:S9 family peptidase n=1 Tax=Sandarakinorhabdus sp. TaxID=1916663 RepID=UPI00286D80B2|nr:S9 family peptidase [Sandarakinorhabdus sp.]
MANGAEVTPAELTLERVFASPSLASARPREAKLSPDGRWATVLRARDTDKDRYDLWAVDTATGRSKMLVDSQKLAGGPLSEAERMNRERKRIADVKGIASYDWAPDAKSLLVPVDGDLWLAGLDGNVKRLTSTTATETDARISPRGGFVSFVRDRALHVLDLASGTERRVAGEDADTISWGAAEFIAQEELKRFDGHWWAPDDSRIAVARVDDGPVGVVQRAAIGADGTRLYAQRYPAAGTSNAVVSLWVMAADGSGRVAVDLGGDADIYLARVDWAADGKTLYVQRLSRDQKRLDLLAVDPATGKASVILSETAKTWLNLHDSLAPLKDGSLIWASERSGYRHLYHWRAGTLTPVTSGKWVVDELRGVDEKAGKLFFTGFADGTLEKHLYAVGIARPGKPKRLTPAGGWHEVVMDKAGTRALVNGQTPSQPAQTWLADTSGKRLAWIAENALDASHPYAPYLSSHVVPQFGTIIADDGQAMDYKLLLPKGPGPHKVYFMVYGGPGAHNIRRTWPAPIEQYLVANGWAVFMMDNRGSDNRGKAFEDVLYRHMGSAEVADQLRALAWVKAQGWAAPDKVAVAGWSYGGYMVLKLLGSAPGAFAAGISGAPVTRWSLYDTAYTERYLGNPALDAAPYTRSDALAGALGITDPLLLIHGMADDNVVFENSTALMATLQKAGRPFEMMVYPGATHAATGLDVHVWKTRLGFLDRVLGK